MLGQEICKDIDDIKEANHRKIFKHKMKAQFF